MWPQRGLEGKPAPLSGVLALGPAPYGTEVWGTVPSLEGTHPTKVGLITGPDSKEFRLCR